MANRMGKHREDKVRVQAYITTRQKAVFVVTAEKLGKTITDLIGEVSGVRAKQRDSAEFMNNMVNNELPLLVNTYGTDKVSMAISQAAGRMLLPSDFRDIFSNVGLVKGNVESTISNSQGELSDSSAVGILEDIKQKLNKLGLK